MMNQKRLYETPEAEPLVLEMDLNVLMSGNSEGLTESTGDWGDGE